MAEMEFEEAMARLEGIIEQLSAGKLTLKESVTLYEEAVKLVGFCRKELSDSQRRIEILRKDLEGQMEVISAEPGEFGMEEAEGEAEVSEDDSEKDPDESLF